MAQQTDHIGDVNKMVTAVEWLINKLESESITDYSFAKAHKLITLDVYMFNKLFEQAKQMEKEQIEDAHIEGQRVFDKHPHTQWTNDQAEQYYNETYKNK